MIMTTDTKNVESDIQAPKGVYDILPQDPNPQNSWHNIDRWHYVESVIRSTAEHYGFREIRTPIFENTSLFTRGVGESSDIVTKEMYTFDDKGGRSITLRPEGTAPVARAFIENKLYAQGPLHKFYYIGPMFRYERPQAGRFRQHYQFGAEAIGNSTPEQDVEMIDMVYTLYIRLGLSGLRFNLNSVGDPESRKNFREALQNYLKPNLEKLSPDSQRRFHINPLRILDSKSPEDQAIVAKAPSILDHLTEESRVHFDKVCRLLTHLEIPYEINSKLVRGLDYYNKTVFEIVAVELGAQNSIGGGGRYDGLIETLGGPDLPSVGFATGMERIILTMIGQNAPFPERPKPLLFIVPLGEASKERCFHLLRQLRQMNLAVEMDFSGKKLNNVMSYANQIGARFAVVIGDEELSSQAVKIKNMTTGTSRQVPIDSLADVLLQIKS